LPSIYSSQTSPESEESNANRKMQAGIRPTSFNS